MGRNGEEYKINLIDTPGHVDFTAEVERSLRVLDGAVAVFDGKEGVEAQSETVWRQADQYNVPRLCFINKMDKIGADFDFSFNTILERLGANGGRGPDPDRARAQFKGIIDLIRGGRTTSTATSKGKTVDREGRSPTSMKETVEKWRHDMLEKVAELDDALMEKYLDGRAEIDRAEDPRRPAQGHDRASSATRCSAGRR